MSFFEIGNEEELADLASMILGGVYVVNDSLYIRRVVGGYIYEYYDFTYDNKQPSGYIRKIVSTVFIPEKL
jgi:hypothetical protein